MAPREGSREERATGWKLDTFALSELETLDADELLFSDVRESVLTDPALRARARGSTQEEHILDWALEGDAWKPPAIPFETKSTSEQPGLTVVDVDGDGLDDLFYLDRWGKTLLLRNRGDGGFEEKAEELGLAFEDLNCCAAFGDFDNDGDADVFIGRTRSPSLYLVNEGGRFSDASDRIEGELPAGTDCSMSI